MIAASSHLSGFFAGEAMAVSMNRNLKVQYNVYPSRGLSFTLRIIERSLCCWGNGKAQGPSEGKKAPDPKRAVLAARKRGLAASLSNITAPAPNHSSTTTPHTPQPWQTTDPVEEIERAIAEIETTSETRETVVATAQMHLKAALVRAAHDEIMETDAAATATARQPAVVAIGAGIEGVGVAGTATVAATGGMITTGTHAMLAPTANHPRGPGAHRQAPGGTSTLVALPSPPENRAQLPVQKQTRT